MTEVSKDAQALIGACKYVVLCLLQRLEGDHPGLIDDLLAQAEADRLAILLSDRMDSPAIEIFVQVDSLLKHAGSIVRSDDDLERRGCDATNPRRRARTSPRSGAANGQSRRSE